MSSYAEILLSKYRLKGVLVDTNLLLLLLVGDSDSAIIKEGLFKRTIQYSLEDYALLKIILQRFPLRLTTPHILTEISNLAGQLSGHRKQRCFDAFLKSFSQFTERMEDSFVAAGRAEFTRFGLTDSVISGMAGEHLVITDDLHLAQELEGAGRDVLNFNHIRSLE